MNGAMVVVAEWVGFAFMAVVAVTALLWLWETTLTKIWKRCIDTADFLTVVKMYADIKKRRRVAGQDE